MIRHRFRISPERYQTVIQEISDGSEPEMRFYLMVAVSTLIASFGLITNSTAVIIGAMLVAPLMTPIFGIALALIRSDRSLFGRALKAEIAGVVAAVLMGIILGLLYPALEPTPEMIARTEPQLFDLLVAVFSGFAGAYALMDEKISPALPGVAIATAIVPPLANTGLCFSVGQYIAGVGSFLLFFANFLSILLVASAAFWFFGMSGRFAQMDRKVVIRRFSLPVLCFLFVAAFLTHTLIQIAQHHYLNEAIETTLKKELLRFPDTSLEKAQYDEKDKEIYILADINSSGVLTPTQVSRLQENIHDEIGLPTHLIVRSKMAREISAVGSRLRLRGKKLDGSFMAAITNPQVREAKIADSLIRDYLTALVGYKLDNVRIIQLDGIPTFLASIYGVTAPSPESIQHMESLLKKELKNPELRLVVSFIENRLYDRDGSIRLEFTELTPDKEETEPAVEKAVKGVIEAIAKMPDMSITGINHNLSEEGIITILVETVGPRILSREDVLGIEEHVAAQNDLPVKLYVYGKAESVVTAVGYENYPSTARTVFRKRLSGMEETIREIIEASNM